MLKGKSFLDYTNSFSSKEFDKNDTVTLKYFQYIETKNLFYR